MPGAVKSRNVSWLKATLCGFGLICLLSGSAAAQRNSAPTGSVFVSPNAKSMVVNKVAVFPFKAPVDLAGASVADVFATELLRSYKYNLIERSQMEQVLGEKALGLQGVTSSSEAIQLGKLLGVEGVILGTVPEYGLRAVEDKQLPALGINVRMISVDDGSIIWSASDSAIGGERDTLSAFSSQMVRRIMSQLNKEWIRNGDTMAVNLPTAALRSIAGGIREITIEIMPQSTNVFSSFRVFRSRTEAGQYSLIGSTKNAGGSKLPVYVDKGLLDAETYYYKVSGVAPSGLNGRPVEARFATTIGAPAPVNSFFAQGNRARQVPLSWQASPEQYVKGYNIYRANTPGGPFQKITYIKKTSTVEYTDKGGKSRPSLADFTDYYYRIHAVNIVDVESPGSQVLEVRTKPIPEPVVGFWAESGEVKQVTLSWDQNAEQDIKEYRIYRGDEPNKVTRKLKDVAPEQLYYSHQKLKDGRDYYYSIEAIDVDGLVSTRSEIISASTKPRPQVPSSLDAALDDDSILLSWASNPELDIAHYEISVSGGFTIDKTGSKVLSAVNSFEFSGLKPGKTAKFKIKAIDDTGLASDSTQTVQVSIPKPEVVQ